MLGAKGLLPPLILANKIGILTIQVRIPTDKGTATAREVASPDEPPGAIWLGMVNMTGPVAVIRHPAMIYPRVRQACSKVLMKYSLKSPKRRIGAAGPVKNWAGGNEQPTGRAGKAAASHWNLSGVWTFPGGHCLQNYAKILQRTIRCRAGCQPVLGSSGLILSPEEKKSASASRQNKRIFYCTALFHCIQKLFHDFPIQIVNNLINYF